MTHTIPELVIGKAMTGYQSDALWCRIRNFEFDDSTAELPYSLRLARDNGWSRHFTARVIEEYRRYCYLTLAGGKQVSPSDAVDQAWHLHLIYTKSYWENFCGKVLKCPLHHNPSRGGAEDRIKFRGLYIETLATYRRVFGSMPPDDIWPTAETRYGQNCAYRRIDVASLWLLPRPRLHWFGLRNVRGTLSQRFSLR